MAEARIVSIKIAAMFIVIVVGWLARRRGYLGDAFTATLSRLVVDVAFPALVFTQMLRTVDKTTLLEGWFYPLLCGILFVVGYFAALFMAPFFSNKEERNTFLFLAAIPNWIFLPLPIAQALYGDTGVRIVLLCNVGAQLMLWSFGVWVLHGKLEQAFRSLITNAGLWATGLGIVVAMAFPWTSKLETIDPATASIAEICGGSLVQAMAMVGSLTIPMSLFAIGAQLGGITIALHRLPRVLWGVLLARLVAGPALTVALTLLIAKLGAPMPDSARMVTYLIAAMPVAISCSVMAERFKGDVQLSAQAIFYSTFFSLLTVPAIFYLVQRLGL